MPAAHPSLLDRIPVPRIHGSPRAGTPRSEPGESARTGRRARLRAAAPALTGAAAGILAFSLVRRSLIDDAYITLCYARNLAFHGQWALVTGHTANTATSPLNVLLLGLAAFLTRHVVFGLGLVFAGSCAALSHLLAGLFDRIGLRRGGGVATALLVIANPLLLSTVGMEVMLVLVIAVATLRAVLAARPVLTGVLLAAMLLTRPDAVVISVVLILAVRGVRKRLHHVVPAATLAALPWFLFSSIVLGAALPDSAIIKMVSDNWGGVSFGLGPSMYYSWNPTVVVAVSAVAVLGFAWTPVAALRAQLGTPWRAPVVALLLAAVAHYLALTVAAPAPFHWYYVPSVGLASIAFGALCSRRLEGGFQTELGAGLVVGLIAAVGYDASLGVPWTISAVSTNWATSAEYGSIGRHVGHLARGAVIESPGEVGELAYFCNCDIVDEFSDRGVFMRELTRWEAGGGATRHAFIGLDYLFAERGQRPQKPTYALVVVSVPGPHLPHWRIGTPWTSTTKNYAHYLELERWSAE